jgi:antibiotic biosynthesis monooxygenase (ABM) superfamily enzyme
MDSTSGRLIYEVIFKVKSTRKAEFEQHCKDTTSFLEGHTGFVSSSFSRRLTDDPDWTHYRVELVFENQDSLNSYQKDVVPKVRSSSTNFGDDAKVEDRRTYEIFHTK